MEARVLHTRQVLRHSLLGDAGAVAIHAALRRAWTAVPSIRTIGRILVRHGQVDHHHRVRRPPPPPGWHLPDVAARRAELDLFDYIEMLRVEQGPLFDVLTTIALHSARPEAWVLPAATTQATVPCLCAHWRRRGRPAYAQMDNDPRFLGTPRRPDVFGRLVRLCLQLEITPVFVSPYEFGLQNQIESWNSLWQRKVWRRYHFATLTAVRTTSARYVTARHVVLTQRGSEGPPRRPWPQAWHWAPDQLHAGTVIYIRRTNDAGQIPLLGHTWRVDPHWCHRLVRAEVDLRAHVIRCYALRRRAPADQPQIAEFPYAYPRNDLVE